MKHHFKHTCYNIDELFKNTKKLSTFMNKLRKQADSQPDMIKPDNYFGHGFEALVEVLIETMGMTPHIQIKDYTPTVENDMGVDGFGYGPNGETHTVQIKARSDADSVLTANKDHISNFVAHSQMKYKAEFMTIFTTAKTLHEGVSEEMYMGGVRTIGYNELRKLLDNNEMFWTHFRDQLKFAIDR